VQPSCELDQSEARPEQDDPTTDGTAVNDGWALFSGTSAAAPQVAGAAAVLLSVRPQAKPAQIIEALRETATDVITGRCHPRFDNLATAGVDAATGHGLVNVSAAVQHAEAHF
jgi:subtilisin family serine protease